MFLLRILVAGVLLVGFQAQAYELALIGGLQSTNVTYDAAGTSTSSETGLRAGLVGFAELSNELFIRSGAIFTERNFSISTDGSTNDRDVKLMYLDVPVTALYMFKETVGVFGGIEVGLKMSDECKQAGSSCGNWKPNSLIYGLTVGGHFRFTPDFGVEISYLMGMNEAVDGTSSTDPAIEKPGGVAFGVMMLF